MTQAVEGSTTTGYTYDAVGNRATMNGASYATTTSNNELTGIPQTYLSPAATQTFDSNGNTLTRASSSGTTTYNWDFENRLTSVVLPGSGGTISFKYDPFGRRIQKVAPSGTTNFVYDGANVLEDVDSSGNVLARYVQSGGIDEPLAETRSTVTSYYQTDGLGSVTSLSTSSHTLANTYTYDTYGSISASTGSVVNRFNFTGREFDSETGVYYYRTRYYDASAGRFLNEDPLRFFSGDVNFYAYVFNNPINYDNPSGYSCTCTYSQSTGHLLCRDESGKVVVDVNGYAGYGPGKNNPAMQGVEDVGPIPVGTYDMLPGYNGKLGHPQIPLRRRGGRSGGFPPSRDPNSFLVHADSTKHPGNASHGCIVVKNAKDRERILDCGGGTVEVSQ